MWIVVASRTSWHARAAGLAAGLALVALSAGGCSGGASTPGASTLPAGSTSATSSSTTSAATSSSAATTTSTTSGSTPPAPQLPTGYLALWPFQTSAQVVAWQESYRSSGAQPWHLDPDSTALAFARGFLRYFEVDRVTSRAVAGSDAHLGVGMAAENGHIATAAVVHLRRFGSDRDAPWVVVGTDDTDLTLTTPRYGGAVTSPVAVGGRISGVDEALKVTVLSPTGVRLGSAGPVAAGGQKQPWSMRVTFGATPPGQVLTIAVSTGGHLFAVERFAVTAVRSSTG